MVFYLDNTSGDGFVMDFCIRDMNVYLQGPRPAYIFVTGPDGKVLTQKLIPDDGIFNGNTKFQDGYADIGMDIRFRSWHRNFSPGRIAPGKSRTPYLSDPLKLPARNFKIAVPAAGKGIYRVYVGSCWDHWISITPDRAMSCGVHPGRGALYVPEGRLDKAYSYVPDNAKQVSFASTEEVEPFNWQITVSELSGKNIAQTKTNEFINYAVLKNPPRGSVLRFSMSGATTGACLHIKGIPAINLS